MSTAEQSRNTSGAPPTLGTVYLVGGGPGEPDLLTIRARDLLQSCDAIVHDKLANQALLGIARGTDRGQIRHVELHDVGIRGGAPALARQNGINALLVRLGMEGKRVVRLKGGDPFVFGRGGEEALALAAAGIPFEIVPGVSAGIAAAAYAGIPVTHRGLATSVTFVTGHEDPNNATSTVDWSALARVGGTIVVFMGMKTLPKIADALQAGGMSPDTPAAVVQWGTYPRQRTIAATLATIADRAAAAGIVAPAITVIGEVVSLRKEIAWFDQRPLFGRRIIVTRAQSSGADTESAGAETHYLPVKSLAAGLREAGAHVIEMPATRIEVLDPGPIREALERITDYQWLIFTSQNAVAIFWAALRATNLDARALKGTKVAAIGPATAESLLAHGLAVDVTPERFVSEGLLDTLRHRTDIAGTRVLYTCAEGSREVLPSGLRALGAMVDTLPVYRSVPADGGAGPRGHHGADEIDLVTFTSASAVGAFVAMVGREVAAQTMAASIGPVTTAAARAAGFRVEIEAAESTTSGLVAAIVSEFTRRAHTADPARSGVRRRSPPPGLPRSGA